MSAIPLLQLGGATFEILGVLLMANAITGVVGVVHLPRLLLSALVRGRIAKGAARLEGLSQEERVSTLQGLACIGLGFGLQAVSTILEVFSS